MVELLPVLIPAALTGAAIALGHMVNRRNSGDATQVQIMGVLQAERDTAKRRADRAERRAELLEDYAGRLRRLMSEANLEVPPWPPVEEKVPA
jgi:hypothetical protein